MNRELFFRMVLARLWRFKLKSFFMALGIVISVLAVILVHSVGIAVRTKFTSYIDTTYPANTVYLAGGNGFMGGGQGADKLTLADVQAVLQNVDGIEKWDPIVFASMNEVSSGSNSAYVSVMGHSEVAEIARNRGVDEGVYFDAGDIRQAKRVALIGPNAARALFGDASPVGQKVFFNNVALEIVGVLEPAGVDPHGRDLDNELHLPYTLLKDKILGRSYISGTTFVIADARLGQLDEIAEEITQVVRRQHDLADGARNDFTVIHSGIMLRMVDKAYRTFDIFLPITVAVTFLVSALLIMGIMTAVVKERTREIGLRKALGATPSDLRWLIISEVLAIAGIGTLVGIAMATATLLALASMFATKFGIEQLYPSAGAVVVAAFLALVASVLGAILPATRAARMNPVSALA